MLRMLVVGREYRSTLLRIKLLCKFLAQLTGALCIRITEQVPCAYAGAPGSTEELCEP